MGHKYWNGYSWRRISDVEARFRRARGEEVVAEAPAPLPPKPLPVKPLEELPAAPAAPADLTDDELERLTAPGGEG